MSDEMPSAESDAGWSCCGHAGYYHGPEVPGCVECRCRNIRPCPIPPAETSIDATEETP